MGFLAPWFFAGLAAVGLPIWIHLLKRHKTDPTPFPSLMFFEQREQSSVKHRRLEYLLLWALRMAMVILLALLFANPYIRRAIPLSGGKKLTVIAVDHSFSMRAGDRLSRAKDQALQVSGSSGPGARTGRAGANADAADRGPRGTSGRDQLHSTQRQPCLVRRARAV